jgi:hypothetical protein
MADVAILNPQVEATPNGYTIPGAQELILRSVKASFDGTGAGGAFVPTLQFVAPNGTVVTECPLGSALAAGASADVSWFPRGGVTSGSAAVGWQHNDTAVATEPNADFEDSASVTWAVTDDPGHSRVKLKATSLGMNPLDDFVFLKTNQVITGIGHSATTNLLIQGNTITLDGKTSVQIEFFCPIAENTATLPAGPPNNQAIGLELWDSYNGGAIVDKGTIAYVIGNTKTSATPLDAGGPVYGAVQLTPASGTHAYAIYGWKNVTGGTSTVFANTFVDGTGNLAAMWYRVTEIPYNAAYPS